MSGAPDKPRVMIITGYGVNCEAESEYAWRLAGADPRRIHLKDLLAEPGHLHDVELLMFIGGFSFGDHMGSGHVFAARVRHHLRADLQRFVEAGKLVLGICNGFQVMVRLGLLPGLDGEFFTPRVALIQNNGGTFQDRWVDLRFETGPCVYTRGIERMSLPVRHGEGKLFADRATLQRLEDEGCVACRYADPATGESTTRFPANPNGSAHAIAGLCDPSGRILGLMPHPEAFLFPENHPTWNRGKTAQHGAGLELFRNAVASLRA